MPAPPDEDLTLIPRGLRDKLDRVGIKLHLSQWQQLTSDERRRLVDQACESPDEIDHYRAELSALIQQRTGRPPDRLDR
jgi:hypothetical protein